MADGGKAQSLAAGRVLSFLARFLIMTTEFINSKKIFAVISAVDLIALESCNLGHRSAEDSMRNEEVFKQAPVEGKARWGRLARLRLLSALLCPNEATGEVFEGLRAEPSDTESQSSSALSWPKVLAD